MNKKLVHRTLENGLQVYFYPDSNKHSVLIDLIVHYGAFHSDFISDGKKVHMRNGMAHLIEHLLYERSKSGNFRELFSHKQMQTNASTYTYVTDYYVDTVEDVEFALQHLIEGISVPVFTREDIEATKPAIYQEIRMRNDEIGRSAYKSKIRNLFQNYSYIDGLGTLEDVESFTYEQVKLCYDTFYQPKNEILFITGNFDVEELYQKIQEIYASLEFQDISFSFSFIPEPIEVKKQYDKIMMPTPKDYVSISYKLDFSRYSNVKRRMLSYYLNFFLREHFGIISPLYKELMDEKVIDTLLDYDFDYLEDYLMITVSGYTNDEEIFTKKVREVLESPKGLKEKFFILNLKDKKMGQLCTDFSLYQLSCQFKENVSYYHYADFDTAEDLESLCFQDFKSFIEGLEFKEYCVTKITDVKKV